MFFLFSSFSYSHGGGLNSQGCHRDSLTQTIHCHKKELTYSIKASSSSKYNRNSFNYESYKPDTQIGFYTKENCMNTNIDHIVSLKDAFESGANKWSQSKKKLFANDDFNHVASCKKINSSKGSATPYVFLKRSQDGKGLDYKIVDFCAYVSKYFEVKKQYNLSFANNNKSVFVSCGKDITKK